MLRRRGGPNELRDELNNSKNQPEDDQRTKRGRVGYSFEISIIKGSDFRSRLDSDIGSTSFSL